MSTVNPTTPRRSIPAVCLVLSAALLAGCSGRAKPAANASNLTLRDATGTDVARAWLDLPKRIPGPGQSFGGTFRLVHARGDFPAGATQKAGRYAAFVGEGGSTLSFNLNPTVADNNVTLAGRRSGDDEVRGNWSLSTFGGAKPRGTFVLEWPVK